MTDKKIKNEKKLLLNSDIKNKEDNNPKTELISIINKIKNLLEKNIPQNCKFLIKKINVLLIKITSLFESSEKDKDLILKYESMLRKQENTIRKLYNNIFFLKSTLDYQENTIFSFMKKEKEFDKLKERIGVFYSNGKLICNGRKDNEILILRTENSNLKSCIENKEKDIMEKENEINKLKEQILIFNKNKKNIEKKKNKNKNNSLPNINDLKCSYSNININFNEINNSNSIMLKNENKLSNGLLTGKNKNIYIPPQLRNDLSIKELFKKRNIYSLYYHKKIKRNKNVSVNCNSNKLNTLSNTDKYISVNKSNYSLLTSKKHERFFSNTINPDMNLGTFSNYNSPSNGKKALNLKSYIEKELTQKKADKIANKIINKMQHSNPGKKKLFYSNFASPMCKYSINKLKKNKLFLK